MNDSGDLSCVLDEAFPVSVVQVTGTLTVATAPTLRRATLKALTSRPDLLLVDVSAMRAGDDVALTALASLSHHAAAVETVLMVVSASPVLRAQLDTMAISRTVPVYASREEAGAAFAQRPAPAYAVVTLLPVAMAGRDAREVTDRFCATWRLDQLADTAALIITELVANAVQHARTELELSIALRRRHLRLAVRDHSPLRPERVIADEYGGGRGLLVIEHLATAWGCTPIFDGKVVWALLRLGPEQRGAGGGLR